MSTTIDLIRGHTYRVDSSRKGKFTGMLVIADETWATFEITSGKARRCTNAFKSLSWIARLALRRW